MIEYTDEAISQIAKMADGGMRNAITMLDKCLSYSKNITLENVLEVLGCEDYTTFFQLLFYLQDKNKDCIKIIEQVYDSGKDLKIFIRDFIKFLLDVMKYQIYGDMQFIKIPPNYKDELDECSKIQELELMSSINNSIKWDSDPKTIIELEILIYCGGKDEN